MEYVAWIQAAGRDGGLTIQAPPGKTSTTNEGTAIIADVMTGMLIFFAFFTGASTAQTIITEDEEGTLSRLFTTSTPAATILGGKLAAVFATLMVQIVVTLVAGRLIFGIRWGNSLSVLMAAVALVATAAGFGIFLMSLVKTSRQAGPVMGGVMTLTGMAGGLMTTGIPNLPAAFHTMNLFTPQGWAMRAFQAALYGGSPGEVLTPMLVSLGVGALFFVIGVLFFRRRFA
jgi:ABC-2 type transport system permease protein